MKKKYFLFLICVINSICLNAFAIRQNNDISITSIKTDFFPFPNKNKKRDYTPEFRKIMKNFSSYKLLDNLKLISKLEGEVDHNSYEMGMLNYYKAYLYVLMDDYVHIHDPQRNLTKIIPNIEDQDKKNILICYNYLITVYFAEGNENENNLYEYSNKINEDSELIKQKNWEYYFLKGKSNTYIANYFVRKKDYEKAQKYAELAKYYYGFLNDAYYFIDYYRTKGYIESESRNHEKAYEYYNEMLEIEVKKHATYSSYNHYPMVAMACYNMGDTKQSSKYMLKFKMTGDTIQNERRIAENYIKANQKNIIEKQGDQEKLFYFATAIAFVLIAGFLVYKFTKKKYINLPPPDFTKNHDLNVKDKITSDELQNIIELSQNNEDAFYLRFIELYPILYKKLKTIEPPLSDSEVMFCMYLHLKYTTKEIAIYSNSSVKSVENKKYRLKKKFGLQPDQSIYSFIDSLQINENSIDE